ncbi:myomegalin-like [Arapaima gigas]
MEIPKHLNDLKKENFSLKLRIYFLEERIQQKYEESSEDVHRRVSEGWMPDLSAFLHSATYTYYAFRLS